MTRIKHNDDISAVNGNKRKGVSRTPKRNISDRNSVEKETNNDTRELVLPSDSNVVKGNV
jgi:hypothetical protein